MTMHTTYELYLYAQEKMTNAEKEAAWGRLLAEADAGNTLRRSLALALHGLAARLAPEIAHPARPALGSGR
jgi:hypothetical protein